MILQNCLVSDYDCINTIVSIGFDPWTPSSVILSHHIISHDIISFDIISYCIVPCNFISSRSVANHVTLCQRASCYVMLCYILFASINLSSHLQTFKDTIWWPTPSIYQSSNSLTNRKLLGLMCIILVSTQDRCRPLGGNDPKISPWKHLDSRGQKI